ncbi:uncharacterized protein LOC122378496 [Amphibalanus amphitrite]|uniref:uncharacterized protein LOC122378496 n=1 Tax=Amphibalanus amphitrite TaxID=1232801 RepID=UPI001C90F226|nr:uncharacterized protein LOC122378496 [Amphibalanus amphitrite]
MERLLFGLTAENVRMIAYEFAKKMGLKTRFSKDSRMAGKDWLQGFLKRHPDLSIRSPEATSMARAVGFNRPQVERFFTIYKEVLDADNYGPAKVWNMDETGISTVQTPGKIVASKGVKRVGKITSAERGKLVTVLCAANAAGGYLPPLLVFGRTRMVGSLMNGAPPGSVGTCTKSGWTDREVFLQWFQHFLKSVKPRVEEKHILILDGHHSHKSIEVIDLAREHGVTIITLPPHSSHSMQPLDVGVFKAIKSSYNSAADSWMRAHPGRRVTEYEVAQIFGTAYTRAATMERAINGFRASGIWPCEMLFTEEDFAPAGLTEEEPDENPMVDGFRPRGERTTVPPERDGGAGPSGVAVPSADGRGAGPSGVAAPRTDGRGAGPSGVAAPRTDGGGAGPSGVAAPPPDGGGAGPSGVAAPPPDGGGAGPSGVAAPSTDAATVEGEPVSRVPAAAGWPPSHHHQLADLELDTTDGPEGKVATPEKRTWNLPDLNWV